MCVSLCVLLTGGSGFLGSHLLARLVNDNFRVVLLKRPTSSLSRIEHYVNRVRIYDIGKTPFREIFAENPIDVVVHCATNYGRDATTPPDVVDANLTLPLQLLQHGSNCGVKAFINSDTILDKGINYYSLSKRQFNEWLRQYGNSLACVNVALEHFFGPFDDRSKFVTSMLFKLLDEVDRIPMTPGFQRRDFIHVDDVVDAFIKVIQFARNVERGFHSFQVGTGKAMSIRELAMLMKKLTRNNNTLLDFGALPYRSNEVMDSVVDLTALRGLGWEPKIDLSDGLVRTIEQERRLRA